MAEEHGGQEPSIGGRKIRPSGLIIITGLWALGLAFNFSYSISTIRLGLGLLPSLADASVPEWFRLGVPAETTISFLIFTLALIQTVTIFGLWTGRTWSYRLALTLTILFVLTSGSSTGLYLLAPAELNLVELVDIVSVVSAVFFVFIYWSYLRKPLVKEFLGIQRDQTLS